jgi:photosystem II stability/assembly factor-like uncharacterized protein
MTSRAALRFLLLGTVLSSLVAAPAGAQSPSEFGNLSYRSLGPAIAGGRATAIAGSNVDPLVYYAGGAGGGVFKSTDGGASWHPVFDREAVAPIGAIAVAPNDPNDVWVGTGEANPRNDVEAGDGLWHSSDGGKSWKHAGLDGAAHISQISIDPHNPSTVVVGVLGRVFADSTVRGIYVTRDGGAHWTRTLYVGPSSGVSDVVRVPDRPSTLFAGVYDFRRQPWMMRSGGPRGGIYRSDDGGLHWRKLTGDGLPGAPTGRIGLAAGTGGRIYAIVQSKQGDLWRSDNGGASWRKMPHSPYVGARPFYFSRIFVDPSDRNRLISVGLDLSMSTDGGKTFKHIAANAGWDYHQAWWSQDGRRVLVASDEGVVISGDGAAHWWQPYDLPFAQPYHVGLGTTLPAYRVCIGLQDDNSWCGWSQAFNGLGLLNRNWEQIAPGDGMWALLDPTDPDLVWSTSTNSDTGQVYLFDARTQQASEVSPYVRSNAVAPKDLAYRFNWDTPIAFTTGTPPAVLVGGNVVFESTDRGAHWQAISPDLTRNDRAHQLASGGPVGLDLSGAETSDTILDVETSALSPGLIWVGTDDGLIQVTRDGGAHWSNVTPPGVPPWGRVSTVDPSHFSAQTAYAVIDRHMVGDDRPYAFVTDDGGATWRSISSNLPKNVFLRSIREDVKDRNLLYAGSQRGMWVSFDRGAHWQSLRLNMPATAIYDIEIQPAADDLVVASHGRGVWILDDLNPLRQLAHAKPTGATLFAPRDAYRMFQWAPVNAFTNGTLPDNVFVGANPPYGALISYYLPAPAKRTPSLEILDARGHVVRHIDGKSVPNVAGINRTSWDLTEDGPVKWTGTFKENQGPDSGPEALPGTYTVRLDVDGRVLDQPLTVKPDPRDPNSEQRSVQRHAFLTELNGELSSVDTWLNQIDARLKHATPAQAKALLAFARRLTYAPRNVEDLGGSYGLRDRIMDMLARLGSSFQAPNAPETTEGAAIRTLYEKLSSEFGALPK